MRGFAAQDFQDEHVQGALEKIGFFHWSDSLPSIEGRWKSRSSPIECQLENFEEGLCRSEGRARSCWWKIEFHPRLDHGDYRQWSPLARFLASAHRARVVTGRAPSTLPSSRGHGG